MWLHHSNIANLGVRLGGKGLELAFHTSFQPLVMTSGRGLRLVVMGVFMSWKPANARHQDFLFPPMEILVYSACLGIHSIWGKPGLSVEAGWAIGRCMLFSAG